MPPKHTTISPNSDTTHIYKNIRTCILKNSVQPTLLFDYSSHPLIYNQIPKLVLAHKMYGFPFYDKKGEYGISRRDNYILLQKTNHEFIQWREFLSTKLALYLFEGTRYRMKYLERYVFQLIPDITKIPNFPSTINDKTISDFFQFTTIEDHAIQTLHKKNYKTL